MSSDSDSDSLPSLADLLPRPSTEINPGDIVWAKFKNLYWPALVRNISKKEKKMRIWFTDVPGKCFKLPFGKIFPFDDPVMTKKIKQEAEEAGVMEAHDGLTSHAISYLNRKAEGYKDDPMKFFDQTYPFFLMENWLKNNPSAAKDTAEDIKIPPLYIDHKPATVIKEKNIKIISCTTDTDIELASSEEDSGNDTCAVDVSWKVEETCNAHEIDYMSKIVNCVKSGKADQYLKDILSKKICSEYEMFYKICINTNKRDLSFISYGPMKNMTQIRELINYLLDFFKCPLNREIDKFKKGQYVASVLLPESVIYAISDIDKVPLSDAKNIFKKYDAGGDTFQSIFTYAIKNANSQDIKISDTSKVPARKDHEIFNEGHKNGLHYDIHSGKNIAIKECIVALYDCMSEINTKEYLKDPSSSTSVSKHSSKRMFKRKRIKI